MLEKHIIYLYKVSSLQDSFYIYFCHINYVFGHDVPTAVCVVPSRKIFVEVLDY